MDTFWNKRFAVIKKVNQSASVNFDEFMNSFSTLEEVWAYLRDIIDQCSDMDHQDTIDDDMPSIDFGDFDLKTFDAEDFDECDNPDASWKIWNPRDKHTDNREVDFCED